MLLKLFLTFLKIGVFTFGGGYAMVALIQSEVVERQGWLTTQEFTDLLALSQMTPGPIGINSATYAGYAAMQAEGYGQGLSVAGAVVASLGVVLLPVVLILGVNYLLSRYKELPVVQFVLKMLRLAVVGIIASAALSLMNAANFGSLGRDMKQLVVSVALFVAAFVVTVLPKREGSKMRRPGPIAMLLIAALVGVAVYW